MLEIKSIDDIVHMSKASFVGCSPAALTNGTRTLATPPWAQSFPAELLARIFLHLRDISVQCYGYPRPSWLALTEVCWAWRQVALDTPGLWTHLVVYGLGYPGLLENILARSRGEYIHLVLKLFVPPNPSSRPQPSDSLNVLGKNLLDGFRAHGARILSLTVKSWAVNCWMLIRELVPSCTFSTLRTLSLEARPDNPVHVDFPRKSFPNHVTIHTSSVHLVLYAHDTSNILRTIHYHSDPVRLRAYASLFPQALKQFTDLTDLHLGYCGPRVTQNIPLHDIFLPRGLERLSIEDEPWEMQSVLSHLIFQNRTQLQAEDAEAGVMDIALQFLDLSVDLRQKKHYTACVLEDTLQAFKWWGVYSFVSSCSFARIDLWPNYALHMDAGTCSSQDTPKFQLAFKRGPEAVIEDIAANLIQNYCRLFSPVEKPEPDVAFSNLTHFSLHDGTGSLGRRLQWGPFLRGLPASVCSLALGNADLVRDFVNALQDLAKAAPEKTCRARKSVHFNEICCCVHDSILSEQRLKTVTGILLMCRKRNVLNVDELILRLPVDASLHHQPGKSTVPRKFGRNCRVSAYREACDTCHSPSSVPRLPTDLAAEKADRATVCLSSNTRPPTSPSHWENIEQIWEEHIGDMAETFEDIDWTHMNI
ncbi:hypothetical protein BD310DRAFT_257756 [Dichomitus squalens]|uniref:F-box domain-containing protein n=1 Tax=Dichomitus squalens TaxID=114155 RepID=A0A4Q9PBT2_9APHY|nr:hypothetical protein BD310DRAFT_257756 [Dichomitus squalens]